jgi:integrase
MAQNFIGCDREQELLLPPSLREWLPEGHLAWFVIDAVAELDLSAFYAVYRADGHGRAAHDPAMMVGLLLYSYAVGERSSRRIERRCVEDVATRVICANQTPDHTTIARFRQRHEAALAGLRIGEVLALRWSDIELLSDPARINVSRTWDPASIDPDTGRRGIEGPVKTGEEGSVTIGQTLLRALLDHKDSSPHGGEDELVFPTSTGEHMNPSNFRTRALDPALARANNALLLAGRPTIPAGVTPHSLRHTFCSLLIANREDLATIAAQMRHADTSTTLRIYTHVMKHRREGVAERLDVAIWGEAPTNSGCKRAASGPETSSPVNRTQTTSALASGK